MSQHYFSTTCSKGPVTVLLGWDRPLGHFFMVIEPETEPSSDEYLYSNLFEKDPFDKGLDYFKAKLTEFGIEVPTSMFEQIERDKNLNVGNRHVMYETDGSFTEEFDSQ